MVYWCIYARFHPFKSTVRLGQVSMYLKKSHPQPGFTGEGEDTINRIEYHTAGSWFTDA